MCPSKWRVRPSNMIHTDLFVKVRKITDLLHHRIVQVESYSEIPKRKSSLDIYTTRNEKVAKIAYVRDYLRGFGWLVLSLSYCYCSRNLY